MPVLASTRTPAATARRKAAAAQLGFPDLLVLLQDSDPGEESARRLLLALGVTLKKGPTPVVTCALADSTGGQLVAVIAKKHSQ